ncbi:MAG: hypothetical protein V7L11_26730 [Nostoc sp.]
MLRDVGDRLSGVSSLDWSAIACFKELIVMPSLGTRHSNYKQ